MCEKLLTSPPETLGGVMISGGVVAFVVTMLGLVQPLGSRRSEYIDRASRE